MGRPMVLLGHMLLLGITGYFALHDKTIFAIFKSHRQLFEIHNYYCYYYHYYYYYYYYYYY